MLEELIFELYEEALPSIEKWQSSFDSFHALTRLNIRECDKWSMEHTVTIFNIGTLKDLTLQTICFYPCFKGSGFKPFFSLQVCDLLIN